MLRERAWHRALFLDRCENSTGNYLDECKNCENCFFTTTGMEDAVNCWRSGDRNKDCLDTVSAFGESELIFYSSLPQDHCYDIDCCYNVVQCKFMEYCAHCFQCQHCFGCCGLVGKKYHIFNRPYEPEEYERRKAEIVAAMKKTGEYGKFFPNYFAANSYEESLSGFYWPLTKEQGEKLGFRMRQSEEQREAAAQDASQVPDRSDQADESVTQSPYWDPVAKRPFQILKEDIAFAQDLKVPLPSTYYMRRLQENFRLIPFDGMLRTVTCGKCRGSTQTSWPKEYDGKILCESCYLREVY
jgi:hypothetical protein